MSGVPTEWWAAKFSMDSIEGQNVAQWLLSIPIVHLLIRSRYWHMGVLIRISGKGASPLIAFSAAVLAFSVVATTCHLTTSNILQTPADLRGDLCPPSLYPRFVGPQLRAGNGLHQSHDCSRNLKTEHFSSLTGLKHSLALWLGSVGGFGDSGVHRLRHRPAHETRKNLPVARLLGEYNHASPPNSIVGRWHA
jgi:hypothetical protein